MSGIKSEDRGDEVSDCGSESASTTAHMTEGERREFFLSHPGFYGDSPLEALRLRNERKKQKVTLSQRRRSRSPRIDDAVAARTSEDENLECHVAEEAWEEPQIDDPILVLDQKYAKMVVEGVKTLELRNYFLHKIKENDKIYIAAKADVHQGRRAWPTIIGPGPKKGEILGSVRFSHQERIIDDEFYHLQHKHRVAYREDAPDGAKNDGRSLRGWYFHSAVMSPFPREYKIKKGSQSWRKFIGWA